MERCDNMNKKVNVPKYGKPVVFLSRLERERYAFETMQETFTCDEGVFRLVPRIDEETVRLNVKEMAGDIVGHLGGRPFLMIVLLEGAKPWAEWLLREFPVRPEVRYVKVSSYCGTETTGEVTLPRDWGVLAPDMPVLVVDDVLDSGLTLKAVKEDLENRGVRCVLMAVGVDKKPGRRVSVEADFRALEMGAEFLVGCGMDYNGHFRELPYIATVVFEGDHKKALQG